MKKLLFLLHLPPPVHGSSMVGRFIKESGVINNQFDCRFINLLASKDVGESGKVTFRKVTGFLSIWFKLFRSLINDRPDLCYLAVTATGAAFYRDILLVALLKLFGVKRVYHMHNKGVSRSANGPLQHLLYRFLFNNSEVILLSKHLYGDIQDFVPESRVHICPNGIPDERKKLESENIELQAEAVDPVQILFLSNLIESKGVFVLLEACARLQKEDLAFNIKFIGGEGDVTASLFQEKVEALNLNGQARYVGKKYGQEKFQAFRSADIFAFPTHYPNECFPLVLLEAMQFSLPIVTTPEGGIADIVEDGVNGFLVSQRSPEALAKKLKVLISDKQKRSEMGKAGRHRYEQKYTIDKFEQRMSGILGNIIQEN